MTWARIRSRLLEAKLPLDVILGETTGRPWGFTLCLWGLLELDFAPDYICERPPVALTYHRRYGFVLVAAQSAATQAVVRPEDVSMVAARLWEHGIVDLRDPDFWALRSTTSMRSPDIVFQYPATPRWSLYADVRRQVVSTLPDKKGAMSFYPIAVTPDQRDDAVRFGS